MFYTKIHSYLKHWKTTAIQTSLYPSDLYWHVMLLYYIWKKESKSTSSTVYQRVIAACSHKQEYHYKSKVVSPNIFLIENLHQVLPNVSYGKKKTAKSTLWQSCSMSSNIHQSKSKFLHKQLFSFFFHPLDVVLAWLLFIYFLKRDSYFDFPQKRTIRIFQKTDAKFRKVK